MRKYPWMKESSPEMKRLAAIGKAKKEAIADGGNGAATFLLETAAAESDAELLRFLTIWAKNRDVRAAARATLDYLAEERSREIAIWAFHEVAGMAGALRRILAEESREVKIFKAEF